MPNWVYQTLIVFEGNPKEVWDAIKGDESLFDFNRLIPMPEEIIDWYTWSMEHWGVKWNAAYAHISTPEDRLKARDARLQAETKRAERWGLPPEIATMMAVESEKLRETAWGVPKSVTEALAKSPILRFETPWQVPMPIYEALAKKLPSHEITIWANYYEDDHFIFTLKQGQVSYRVDPRTCFDEERDEGYCVVSTPGKGRCRNSATHGDNDGNQFCDEHPAVLSPSGRLAVRIETN